jgi:hypothetical protein
MSEHALRRAALQTLGQHIVIAKRHVSFGSFTAQLVKAEILICPLWSNSG